MPTVRRFYLAGSLLAWLIVGCNADELVDPAGEGALAAASGATPKAPSSTKAVPSSATVIDLTWRDNATNETGFELHRSTTGASGAFQLRGLLGADAASTSDGGLTPLTEYCYQVRSYRTTGNKKTYSAFSNTACATTPAPPPPPPPPQIQVTAVTTGVDLDPDGYWIEVWKPSIGGLTYVASGVVPSNGTVTIVIDPPLVVLSPGPFQIGLSGSVAANCNVTTANPQVTEASTVLFEITCEPASQLAIASTADGNAEIYLIKSNGTERTRLTTNPAADNQPAWSPDGSRIAFTSDRDGNAEIYVMGADGSNPIRLTNAPGEESRPAWSPDGSHIAFTSDRDGNREIYVMNADGTGPVNLSNSPADDGDPAWSPDGTTIAFRSDRDGSPSIYAMTADGSAVTRLTAEWDAVDSQPAWSPNGNGIAFTRWWCGQSGCKSDILAMNRDGSGVGWVTVADGSSGDTHGDPAWSPDGRKIAFSSPYGGIMVIRVDGTGGGVGIGAGTVSLTDGFNPSWQR